MKHSFRVAILVFAALPLFGGGHINVHNGQPVVYRTTSPVAYRIDQGPLGQFADTTAQRLIRESFQVWQNVSTAVITFSDAGLLPVNVTAANYATYIGNYSDGINPMVFDHDGSIIDAMIGQGASANVIGFAGSAYATGGPNAGFYTEGHAVLNGTMAGTVFTYAQFKATVIHELGHFIGLDHAQINALYARDGNQTNDSFIPTMYPTSVDNDTALASLNPDDILAVSRLYPATGFLTSTGTISGTVTRGDASPVRGANVVAVRTTDSLMYQVSTVTDYLKAVNGSYSITGLAPGSYWVFIEPIRASFTGGSSVGPYAESGSDLSFQNPVIKEYFNGASESDDPNTDQPMDRVILNVTAGAVTTASLVANAPPAPPSGTTLQYHGTPTFVFELPSEFDDRKYAVRFTPGVNGGLQKTDLLLQNPPSGIEGAGSLRVTVHQHTTGSVEGVPGTQIGGNVTVPFTSLTAGTTNEIDLTSLNVTVQTGVNFHIAFEVVGSPGDTLQFIGDDGSVPTNRSSSWYDAGSGFQWYNFSDPSNYATGYNLVVRAFLNIPSSAGGETVVLYPEGYAVGPNYPNPFNPSTVIPFTVPEEANVTLTIVDLLGRTVRTAFADRPMPAGRHTATFDAAGLESGTYVAVLKVGGQLFTRRMLLLR